MKRISLIAALAVLALATPASAKQSRWVPSLVPNPLGNAPIQRLELASDGPIIRKDRLGIPGLMYIVITNDDGVVTSSLDVRDNTFSTFICYGPIRVRFDDEPTVNFRCNSLPSSIKNMVFVESSEFALRAMTARRIMIEGVIRPQSSEKAIMTFTTGMPAPR